MSLATLALSREVAYAARLRKDPSRDGDIVEHLPRLRSLASECSTVTEFGTRGGDSTVAFVAAQVSALRCYDIEDCAEAIDPVRRTAGRTQVSFVQADVLTVVIEPTDLLFIDTLHTYGQLSRELGMHGERALKWIVLHDTVTFGRRDEVGAGPGLWPAVQEFVERGLWRIAEHYNNNNGLTVLARV